MGAILTGKANKRAITVDMEIFVALCDISSKHKCGAGDLMGVYLAAGLEDWMPDFRKSMTSTFGKGAEKAIDALYLEGWLIPLNKGGKTLAKKEQIDTPLDTPVEALGRAWVRLTGETVPPLAKKRLYSQMCVAHPGGPSKLTDEVARLYRTLFPNGTFSSFVSDAYKHSDSMDKAAGVASLGQIENDTLQRWKTIWAIATRLLPGSKFSSDPYVFFCCAVNPRFNEKLFEKNLTAYSPWDALQLSVRRTKRQPRVEALRSAH